MRICLGMPRRRRRRTGSCRSSCRSSGCRRTRCCRQCSRRIRSSCSSPSARCGRSSSPRRREMWTRPPPRAHLERTCRRRRGPRPCCRRRGRRRPCHPLSPLAASTMGRVPVGRCGQPHATRQIWTKQWSRSMTWQQRADGKSMQTTRLIGAASAMSAPIPACTTEGRSLKAEGWVPTRASGSRHPPLRKPLLQRQGMTFLITVSVEVHLPH
mmetsp:Transcript_137931/g.440474  ORF Transcript_137931/g.440474 Transcript_137931/m.440474 type:complete len:212 (+) Transcript_137931:72-707(+)